MVKIILGNKIRVEDAPKNIVEDVTYYLTMVNPKHEEAERLGYSTYGINRYIRNFDFISYNTIEIPRGCRKYIINLMLKNNIEYKVIDNRSMHEHIPELCSANIDLRKYQMKYIQDMLSRGEQEGVIVSPAGSGKTVMGMSIYSVIGQPALWLTHTETLFKQAVSRIKTFVPAAGEEDIGTIRRNKWNVGKRFTVGMVQTMVRNPEKVKAITNEFGMVILDEAHHCPARTFTEVLSLLNPYFLFGLTATPNRSDRLERLMYDAIGPIVVNIPVKEIEKDGGIILPTVIYKETDTKKIDDNNVGKLLKYLIHNKKRNTMIVSDILNEAMSGEICIALSTRKEHCEMLYNLTKISWDKTGIATGDYPEKHNEQVIKDLEDGKITTIFTTPDLLGEGFDIDILSRGFICLPFRSETRVEQVIGRIQRYHKNKKDVKIYDYVDTNVGVFKDQFHSVNKNKDSRSKVYNRLGISMVPG